MSGGRVGSTGRYSVLQKTAQKLGDDGRRRLGCLTLTAGLRMVLQKNAGRGQDGVDAKDGKTRSCYTLIRLDAVENIFDFTHTHCVETSASHPPTATKTPEPQCKLRTSRIFLHGNFRRSIQRIFCTHFRCGKKLAGINKAADWLPATSTTKQLSPHRQPPLHRQPPVHRQSPPHRKPGLWAGRPVGGRGGDGGGFGL